MKYEVIRDQFYECLDLTWDVINTQVEKEIQNNTCRIIGNDEEKTILLLDNENFHPIISKMYAIMRYKYRLTTLHIYTSQNNAQTFGRHCDQSDVLIVQSIGKMSYKFDDGELIVLKPGDGVYIPKGMYHDPIPIEPRVSLSFSWN
jgi:ribosomal protein L16 Arg81 hydroxylase